MRNFTTLVLCGIVLGCTTTRSPEPPPPTGPVCGTPDIVDLRDPPVPWTEADRMALSRATEYCLSRGKCLLWFRVWDERTYRAFCSIPKSPHVPLSGDTP